MEQLHRNQYKTIFPIVSNIKTTPAFVYSAITGILPGKVWVDRVERPASVLVALDNGLYFAAGEEPDPEFASYLSEKNKETSQRFTLFSPSSAWNDWLLASVDGAFQAIQRLAFQYPQHGFWKQGESVGAMASGEFVLKRIDEAVIAHSREFSAEYYRNYWGSIAQFIQHGLGYAVMQQDKIVCECTSIFGNPEQAEMDIVTSEEYRGQGWGLVCAQAFIEETLRRKAVPRWDCHADNTASKKMAYRLGFADPVAYTVYVRK
ncbi:GNAT family N-acetyltransferase [Brevibacillus migulae]|uniref:GNAT family N-acetyltransferase n=1 Tax=Brevibacillus migulae TaxID=1644114 RepID=UPI00106ED02B|nr:GNAT family N-acetyltransferase [Brevibacillus migulae]